MAHSMYLLAGLESDDLGFAQVAEAWPRLPDRIRSAILALVEAAGIRTNSDR
jgi:hypothetical protein